MGHYHDCPHCGVEDHNHDCEGKRTETKRIQRRSYKRLNAVGKAAWRKRNGGKAP